MIITINVSVGESAWGQDRVRKEVEVKTESTQPIYLPWEQICANLVEVALEEWECEEKQKTAKKLEVQDAS